MSVYAAMNNAILLSAAALFAKAQQDTWKWKENESARATRLGVLAYILLLYRLLFWEVFENYTSSQKLLDYFLHGQSFVLFLTKNGLGYTYGDFFQTHLVTLLSFEKLVN
jgi:hypothetical protein